VDQRPLPWPELHVAPGVYTNLLFLRNSTDFNLADCELHLTPTYPLLNLKISSQRKMMAILVLACRMGTPVRVISEVEFFLPELRQFLTKSKVIWSTGRLRPENAFTWSAPRRATL